ncbi:MAG: DUF106 domain-containing protein [Nanoarchaeota archaeon]|nr:DUF106 domain-containing protein [Nanoarchaeota archaeon]
MTITDLMIANPKLSIIIFALLVTLVMTLITKKVTDQNRMRELKEIQKKCQINIKDSKGDLKKQKEIQKEMMQCSMELMKHSFKPMLITMIPILILIWWIRSIYSTVFPGWIWWYLVSAMASSIILRKIFKVV